MAQTREATFLYGTNSAFIAELYEHYLSDPNGVDQSWRSFFDELRDDAVSVQAEVKGPSWQKIAKRIIGSDGAGAAPAKKTNGATAPVLSEEAVKQAATDSIRALQLIRAYRVRGHLEASLDPLGLHKPEPHPELHPEHYGFTDADYDRPIYIAGVLGLENATLREIYAVLRDTYCGSVGVEYMHIQDPAQKAWIQEQIEGALNRANFPATEKTELLERLTAAESFERFLDKRFTGTKRFGLEGGETMIPALEEIIRTAGRLGVKEIVLGMAHRGRLNTLANVMGKRFAAIFSEFQGNPANPEDVQGSGDVKYHLGTSSDREFEGNTVHLSLTANPSHLEAVNPLVLGKVRAKQRQRGDIERTQVVGLLIHGDAAFAGQGLVAESLDLTELKGYRTGGTIHFIINNQIGFTTAPQYARSGPYCSDVAKSIQAPIFHVNGDDPEAVVHVCRIATEFRQVFKKDVVVDMFCYRRHGHNETDEPAFTQPLMYRKIATQPTTRQIYAEKLVGEGTLDQAKSDQIVTDFLSKMEAEFEAGKSYKPNKADWFEGAWAGFGLAPDDDRRGNTAVPLETLKQIGKALTTVPEGFNLNRKLVRLFQEKAKMFETGEGFDWGTAEALAFGSIAADGMFVRLSGQDVGRGTFSHRHAVLVDQETEQTYLPVNNIREGQAQVEIIDSFLSEAAVLGFDYGYSMAEPRALVLWEGQFGDFANGAQVIIDQFITSAESKWLRMSGIVMLLPHGYEGQGPEHSSARLERYLQMCGEDNIQVCNISNPANYFHALRRQVCRNFRKPLIIMSPKSMLRAKLSNLADMAEGTTFHRVYGEAEKLVADDKVKRVVLCSGKLYHELLAARTERKIKDVALVRVEQLYPFPFNALGKELKRYTKAEVVWCQEEHQNMGAWTFVDRRIETLLSGLDIKAKRPVYVGRAESAATATGSMKKHVAQQQKVIDDALTLR
ncbi:2-oxoglutarate dehydrogenase subunit E1 [Aliidongia dinghuensis]|uniref:2-oxoglutarate dehydrogenase E1 component n=1 Tax=Aliidongia dinghuensis TaxID=1867774 RepID=A0A8J2YQV0_9PROT|nr:2-oxoglutarate dehydrogenase E1 component [Aliidongia dinghuensis]GGF08484.1 2-oxoglutarate dehydrogenase subunit E1 [Aliidongia dinghuensis]